MEHPVVPESAEVLNKQTKQKTNGVKVCQMDT